MSEQVRAPPLADAAALHVVAHERAERVRVQRFAGFREEERELIRERVRSGIARVKATGRTRSGRAVSRPRRDVDVPAALAMRAQGRSWREIAQALKVPGRTLRRAYKASGA